MFTFLKGTTAILRPEMPAEQVLRSTTAVQNLTNGAILASVGFVADDYFHAAMNTQWRGYNGHNLLYWFVYLYSSDSIQATKTDIIWLNSQTLETILSLFTSTMAEGQYPLSIPLLYTATEKRQAVTYK